MFFKPSKWSQKGYTLLCGQPKLLALQPVWYPHKAVLLGLHLNGWLPTLFIDAALGVESEIRKVAQQKILRLFRRRIVPWLARKCLLLRASSRSTSETIQVPDGAKITLFSFFTVTDRFATVYQLCGDCVIPVVYSCYTFGNLTDTVDCDLFTFLMGIYSTYPVLPNQLLTGCELFANCAARVVPTWDILGFSTDIVDY